jgi:hypothetical protein
MSDAKVTLPESVLRVALGQPKKYLPGSFVLPQGLTEPTLDLEHASHAVVRNGKFSVPVGVFGIDTTVCNREVSLSICVL